MANRTQQYMERSFTKTKSALSRDAEKVVLSIMALIGFSSYCTLKLLFSRVTVLPPMVTVLPQV
jgi:hypothetical protein